MTVKWDQVNGECLLCEETEAMFYRQAADGAHLIKCRECQSQFEGSNRADVEFASTDQSLPKKT